MIRVAIDGPSSAGKSTVARRLAKDFSIVYVDTGAMYRCIGLYVLRQGFDTRDRQAVCQCLDFIRMETSYDEVSGQRIFLNGEDVSEAIRTPEASMAASNVSAIPEVRSFLLALQQDMASHQSVIMDGRDIGTVVIPDAELKIFLTASAESRAHRRCLEYQQKGMTRFSAMSSSATSRIPPALPLRCVKQRMLSSSTPPTSGLRRRSH